MGKFDNIFNTPETPIGGSLKVSKNIGRFDNIFANQPIQQTEIPIEQPSKLTQITGGFQEAIGGTGNTFVERLKNVGKKIGGAIWNVGKSVVEHPVITTGSVVKGVMDFNFNVAKGISKLVGTDNATKYIQDNKVAIDEIFNSNLKDKSEQTAGAVGKFVGEQIPYILGGELAGVVGTAGAMASLSKYGGGLSLKAITNIGNITKWASETAGFMGVHQMAYTPEEGSRADIAKSDLLVLGVLGGIGLAGSAIKDAKMKAKIRSFVTATSNKSLSEIETGTKQLLEEIKTTTGKEPKVLAGETLKQYPINLKEIPLQTKMGDVAKLAETQGFPEYGKIKFKPTPQEEKAIIKKSLTAGNVQQVNRQAEQFGGKESGMWERVAPKVSKAEQEVMEYQGITLKGAVNRAEQIVNEDSARAYRIAMGLERSPADTTNSMVNRVLVERAKKEGNLELQSELIKNRTLSQIRRGQEIVSEREIQGGLARDNVSFNMKQVIDERAKLLEQKIKMPAKQAVEKEIGSLKTKIRIPTKVDWNNFIDEIKCG